LYIFLDKTVGVAFVAEGEVTLGVLFLQTGGLSITSIIGKSAIGRDADGDQRDQRQWRF